MSNNFSRSTKLCYWNFGGKMLITENTLCSCSCDVATLLITENTHIIYLGLPGNMVWCFTGERDPVHIFIFINFYFLINLEYNKRSKHSSQLKTFLKYIYNKKNSSISESVTTIASYIFTPL